MLVYALLIYIGLRASFPMWYFLVCTVGICFRLFALMIDAGNKIKQKQLMRELIEKLEEEDNTDGNE